MDVYQNICNVQNVQNVHLWINKDFIQSKAICRDSSPNTTNTTQLKVSFEAPSSCVYGLLANWVYFNTCYRSLFIATKFKSLSLFYSSLFNIFQDFIPDIAKKMNIFVQNWYIPKTLIIFHFFSPIINLFKILWLV